MAVRRQLAELNDQYIQALLDGDRNWFQGRLADEFVCVEGDGAVRNKAEFLQKVSAGPSYARYRLEDVQVRVFGEVGLVRATGVFCRSDGTSGTSRYTDVYVWMDHEWKVVSAQITRADTLLAPMRAP